RLPPQADAARIAASIQNGVLTVVVPKSKAAVGRKIEVR
ncbi:MAG: Hsp20 family protein, partial [Gammaproteobacteria bacterium]